MAMSVTYTNVLGQVLFEDRGGNQTEFIPDPLGNVVKCRNSGISYSYSAEYWPYGEIQTSSGTNPSNFGYVGTWGYYKDASNQIYVRARYYKPVQARWMTVDPLWPGEKAYGYVDGMPLAKIDQSGTKPVPKGAITCTKEWRNWISDYCFECRKSKRRGCNVICNSYIKAYNRACQNPNPKPQIEPPLTSGERSCKSIYERYNERFDGNGNVNDFWKADCFACCGHLYQDSAIGVIPESTDLLKLCMCNCGDGHPPLGG